MIDKMIGSGIVVKKRVGFISVRQVRILWYRLSAGASNVLELSVRQPWSHVNLNLTMSSKNRCINICEDRFTGSSLKHGS